MSPLSMSCSALGGAFMCLSLLGLLGDHSSEKTSIAFGFISLMFFMGTLLVYLGNIVDELEELKSKPANDRASA